MLTNHRSTIKLPASRAVSSVLHTLHRHHVGQHLRHPAKLHGTVQPNASQPRSRRPRVVTHADIGKAQPVSTSSSFASVAFNNRHDAEIWGLALPAFLSLVLDPLMAAINTAVVGKLGTQALAAVSMGSLWVMFAGFIFSFLLFLTTPKIAAAVSRKDMKQVSKTTADTLWVALCIGVLMTIVMQIGAEPLIAVIDPPEAQVRVMALEYIRIRALGITATLLVYAANGSYRGFRDTATPLLASVIAAVVNFLMNLLLIFGLGLGVQGSGLATAIANWTTCGVLLMLLMRKGRLLLSDLMTPPPWSSVAPMLRAGMLLSGRTFISMGLVMYATTLCVRTSSVAASSFEVLRQLWILSIQFFECLNVSCQALCAAYLGSGDRTTATEVLVRISFLGAMIGSGIGLIVFMFQTPLVSMFTTDALVLVEVSLALPLLCWFFPMDALASIMDGALFAGQQSDFVSYVTIWGTFAQIALLGYITANGLVSALLVWAVIKLLTVIRVAASGWRLLKSSHSPYLISSPAM